MEDSGNGRLDKGSIAMIVCTAILVVLMVGLILTMLRIKLGKKDGFDAAVEAAGIISEKYYFYDNDEDTMAEDAIRGMLSGIDDPYAAYYTQEEYDAMLASDSGDYQGIGISVQAPDESGAYILSVYPDSPMAEAGVLAGDVITSVNGTAVAGLSMNDFLVLFSSDDEEMDVIGLIRGNERFSVNVTRRAVHATRVSTELLDGNIGYVSIEQFNGSVISEFWKAVSGLRDQGVTQLIIDLRDNPGGGLTEVLGVAGCLVPQGEVICTIKSRGDAEVVYRSEGTERIDNMSICVLVNGNSASASELLSGALKDHNLAIIVGTQTYGKGIVQSYYRLKNNAGWVKLTTDAYYTPNGVCIHGAGITPDRFVEQSEEYAGLSPKLVPHEADAQLQAAVELLQSAMPAAA